MIKTFAECMWKTLNRTLTDNATSLHNPNSGPVLISYRILISKGSNTVSQIYKEVWITYIFFRSFVGRSEIHNSMHYIEYLANVT